MDCSCAGLIKVEDASSIPKLWLPLHIDFKIVVELHDIMRIE